MDYEVDKSVNLALVSGRKLVVHLADVETHDPDRQRYPPGLVSFPDPLVIDFSAAACPSSVQWNLTFSNMLKKCIGPQCSPSWYFASENTCNQGLIVSWEPVCKFDIFELTGKYTCASLRVCRYACTGHGCSQSQSGQHCGTTIPCTSPATHEVVEIIAFCWGGGVVSGFS